MDSPKVAIIIPVKKFNAKLKKSIEKCLELDYQNFEIMVFPDEEFSEFSGKIKVIPTGSIGPALKRDLALKHSQAELFAFIDDDAYPRKDWLKNAVKHFAVAEVAAVGGPSITPEESSQLEKASGEVFSSILVSSKYTYRYIPGEKVMEVDDYPSCNFIVRRSVFEQVGGFDSAFYPGEDTKLCLEITKTLGLKIIYDPEVLVWHHRRSLFMPHLRQVANYALHRGYFAKKFPGNSRKPAYFIPSLFVLYLIMGWIATFLNPQADIIYYNTIVFYYSLMFFHTFMRLFNKPDEVTILGKLNFILLVTSGMILTHLAYGVYFFIGLFSKNMKEENPKL